MRRFLKIFAACLFLLGLFLVLCMGGSMSVVLLPFFYLGHPYLLWILAAFLLAVPVSAWRTRKSRDLEGSKKST